MKTLHGTQRDYYEHLQNFIQFCRAQESTEWDRAYLEAPTKERTIQQTQMMCDGVSQGLFKRRPSEAFKTD